MRQKHNLFLDIRGVHATVDLPGDIHDRKVVKATLYHWNVEGMEETTDDYVSTGFYIQAKFTGCLESRSIAFNARSDMLQIPTRSFNGWGISPHPIPIAVVGQPYTRRFEVDLYQEGEGPSILAPPVGATLRVILWIELETESM